MKFCPECGAKLVSQKFCQECGANISKYLNGAKESTSAGIGSFDFSALEAEAQSQLAEQERRKDFEIENGVLIKYVGKGGKVVVPKDVTVIGANAFAHNWSVREGITEVIFEGNVTQIEECAFQYCSRLTKIELPRTVKKIGKEAFAGAGITSIALPSGLEKIAEGAFGGSQLTSITIPARVSLGENASWNGIFARCKYLRTVTIENGVTAIQPYMFDDCGALESVVIPNSVKSIGSGAFRRCVSLRSVTIPYGVSALENVLFEGCTSLTRIDLPGSITRIENGAFSGCRSLTGITIPQSVTFIGDEVFADCVALEKMQYNAASVRMIGTGSRGSFSFSAFLGAKDNSSSGELHYSGFRNRAFENAGSERGGIHVTFGSGVRNVPDGLFHAKNCKIASVSFEGGSDCCRIGEYAFYECSMIRSVQMPSYVEEIGQYAFCMCSSLSSINLPSRVKKIGQRAFGSCKSITSITLPAGLSSIEEGTFSGCERLSSVTIPYGVQKIDKNAFLSCDSLTSIEIPSSVMEIGEYALRIRGRLSLKLPERFEYLPYREEYEFVRDDWSWKVY